MTRARLFALAVLVGMSSQVFQSANAQSGSSAPVYGAPGPEFFGNGGDSMSPYETPVPPDGDPWYVNPEMVDTGRRQVGPLVRTDGAFLRVEYLNWNIQKPGNELLGAPVTGVGDPSRPFLVFAPGNTVPEGIATVPTTAGMNLGNMSGIQVTGGISLIDDGSFEISAFMLARKSTGYTLSNLGSPVDLTSFGFTGISVPVVVATSTLFNGNVSDHLLLYNTSYQAVFQSQLWGAEANYLYDLDAVGFLQFRPLFGVRYLNLTERLTQTGVFQDIAPNAPIVTTIDSHTTNNLWGAQLGFRTSVVTQYLEMGLTPKILVLGDTMTANVFTNHLRSNFDPIVGSSSHTTTGVFGSEVGAFAQMNLTPNFSIRGGYNLLWLGRVTRPQKDVYYNDNGPLAAPAIASRTVFSDVLITGFSVGAEIRY